MNSTEQNAIIDTIQKNNIQEKLIEQIERSNLLYYLEENRVLLPFLEGLNEEDIHLDNLKDEISKMLKNDYVGNLDKVTDFIFDLFSQLNIDWMSHKHSFFERQRGDIDVLVQPQNYQKAIESLKQNDFDIVINERSKIKFTKKINSQNFTIHLHEKIIWETEFINTQDVWQRSRLIQYKTKQLRIPSPEDSLVIECVHTFFESRKIILSTVLEFISTLEKEKIDWEKIISILNSYNLISVGYVYFFSLSHLLNHNFKTNLIPKNFLETLFSKIPSNEKKIIEKILTFTYNNEDFIFPLSFGLLNPSILFVKFNANRGFSPFLQALFSLGIAGIRHFMVLIKLKKL